MPNISDLQLAAFSKIYGSGLSINDMWIKFLTADGNSRVSALTDLQTPKVMASPPTLGAAATATAIASPQIRKTSTSATNAVVDTTFFSTPVGGAWVKLGTSSPDYNFVQLTNPTTGYGTQRCTIEFVVDCLAFEIMYKGSSSNANLWVDGELVTTAIVPAADSLSYFKPVTFSTRAVRHIAIETDFIFKFGGIVIGPNDTVMPSTVRRPKCLVIGDSFSAGNGVSTPYNAFTSQLGARLGWDVWSQAQGGTGYTNAGSYSKFGSRLAAHAAIPFDIVLFVGGINDLGYRVTLQADAEAAFALAKTTWPKALVMASSALFAKGVEGWDFSYTQVLSYIKAAASSQNIMYLDLLEMPFAGNTGVSGTVTTIHNLGATTLLSSVSFPVGGTIEISTGLITVERRVVTAVSGTGPYTLTIAASVYGHAVGETITQVGNCLWTGTGKVGATTGTGNCDLYVSSDGVHPTDAGHAAIGSALAHAIAYQLKVASQ